MSPERLMSLRDVDARTDVWSLGVALTELVTAIPPFPAGSIQELCAKVLTQPPISPRSVRPELPLEFDAVVSGCLEKDPARRYADAGELSAALAPFAGQRGVLPAARLEGSRRCEHEPSSGSGFLLPVHRPDGAYEVSRPSVATRGTVQGLQPVERALPPPLPGNGAELVIWRKQRRLTKAGLAAQLNINERTIRRAEDSADKPLGRALLAALETLRRDPSTPAPNV